MKTHELKTIQPHFEHVRSGVKRAEIRRDDRGFAVGDVLVLKEYDATTDCYSGREVRATVTHVLAGYEALAPGFVMLSIESQPSALATARAEAALAERAACVSDIALVLDVDYERDGFLATYELAGREAIKAIRARTTPAALSTDTLAAIAEARGLRLVEPELVAEVPVLRWEPAESGPNRVATVGRWVLEASSEHWAVMVTYENGGVKDEVSDGTATGLREAMRAAQDELRKLGVAFRTE